MMSILTRETSRVEAEFNRPLTKESELVIGLVGAVGTNLDKITERLKLRLPHYRYQKQVIRISDDIIEPLSAKLSLPQKEEGEDEGTRINRLMTNGDIIRQQSGKNEILALGAANQISVVRQKADEKSGQKNIPRAFIVRSLKNPSEVAKLREIYSSGFYLIGVHCDASQRKLHLVNDLQIKPTDADKLIQRDNEDEEHGQRTRDTFHLADFFVHLDSDSLDRNFNESVDRILELIFGNPFLTPTFDEFAMFMAFSAALRSADLSRQVGAVVTKNNEIVSTGANDVPKAFWGLYWPELNSINGKIEDAVNGRDYMRGYDSNKKERKEIIDDLLNKIQAKEPSIEPEHIRKAIKESKLKDITEYGRVVHAEMEAILSCARNGISIKNATLYCTTFPCHNCAKHIICSGIKDVIYIEPYPKSKAAQFHSDSLSIGLNGETDKVVFKPFVGVGPRRFFDLFSMDLGSGRRLKRKDAEGNIIPWKISDGTVRIKLQRISYLEREQCAVESFKISLARKDRRHDNT